MEFKTTATNGDTIKTWTGKIKETITQTQANKMAFDKMTWGEMIPCTLVMVEKDDNG